MHRSIKTYGNEVGLSCCFRQWRTDSHCNKLHGYSLGFRFIFEAAKLDEHNNNVASIVNRVLVVFIVIIEIVFSFSAKYLK